jgi:cell division septation protein DedD
MLRFIIGFSFIITAYSVPIVEHNEIGVIELTENQNETRNDTQIQQDLLRRRLMPGGLTLQDKQSILDAHNRYRTLTAEGQTYGQPSASNMNQLIWDDGLAQVAQQYSQQCIWAHNPNRASSLLNFLGSTSFQYTNQQVGENLFISTGAENIDVLLQGIQYWYEEYTYYTYGTVAKSEVCESGQQCGHYTQLIWGTTRYVGCGYTKCPTTSGLSLTNSILLVCNYYFAGNIVGDYPYSLGSPATNCASDRSSQNNLCSGCPNPAWDSYCCEYCNPTSCLQAQVSNLLNSPLSCTNGLGVGMTGSPNPNSPAVVANNAVTTRHPTVAPTTQSPTTHAPTTKAPTTKTPTTPSPTSHSTKKQCCKSTNSRYINFCSSIGTLSDVCNTYSSVCSWGDC